MVVADQYSGPLHLDDTSIGIIGHWNLSYLDLENSGYKKGILVHMF